MVADDDRKKNRPKAANATYTANQVQDILQQELESILQLKPYTSESPTVNPSTEVLIARANASINAEEIYRIVSEL